MNGITFFPIPHLFDTRSSSTFFLKSTRTSLSGSLQQLSSGCKCKHKTSEQIKHVQVD